MWGSEGGWERVNDLMYTHVIIMCDLYGALLLPEPLCGEPVTDLEKMAQPFLKCC